MDAAAEGGNQSLWMEGLREAAETVNPRDMEGLMDRLQRDLADQHPWEDAAGRFIDALDEGIRRPPVIESHEALADSMEVYFKEHYLESVNPWRSSRPSFTTMGPTCPEFTSVIKETPPSRPLAPCASGKPKPLSMNAMI